MPMCDLMSVSVIIIIIISICLHVTHTIEAHEHTNKEIDALTITYSLHMTTIY